MAARKFYDRYHRVIGIQLDFFEPSLTEQCHKDDCDVNVILQRFAKTGVLPENTRRGVFGDFSALPDDYREACALIEDARKRFDSLPSAVRERFNNDPAQLLEFLDNPDNESEARKLGILATVPADDSDARARERACATGATGEPGADTDASATAKKE